MADVISDIINSASVLGEQVARAAESSTSRVSGLGGVAGMTAGQQAPATSGGGTSVLGDAFSSIFKVLGGVLSNQTTPTKSQGNVAGYGPSQLDSTRTNVGRAGVPDGGGFGGVSTNTLLWIAVAGAVIWFLAKKKK